MKSGQEAGGPADHRKEGKVLLDVRPTGKDRGPGKRGGVFFNPAMVNNRDLSVIMISTLVEEGLLPGRVIRILDGLCGSGARAVRIAAEVRSAGKKMSFHGVDRDPKCIGNALTNASLNNVDVDFRMGDLALHLASEKYSYIDVDPFGSPVPFIQNALSSIMNGGVLGVTATDTAALTGSIPRVAIRRYGSRIVKTDHMHEIACRTLLGYIVRCGASLEKGVEPLFFYSSDHFVRGYVKVRRGAQRADRALEDIGWMMEGGPGNPEIISFREVHRSITDDKRPIGPLWTGDLEDPDIVNKLKGALEDVYWDYLATRDMIDKMLGRALGENGLPPGGYHADSISHLLKLSPPSMSSILEYLREAGFKGSRSRFCDKTFKTDAPWKQVRSIFEKEAE